MVFKIKEAVVAQKHSVCKRECPDGCGFDYLTYSVKLIEEKKNALLRFATHRKVWNGVSKH